MGHDAGMTLVAVAAFTAAGLSLVNVVMTAWLSGRSKLKQWRRDTELPILARVMELSEDARQTWADTVKAKIYQYKERQRGNEISQEQIIESWQRGRALFAKLRYEVAQLDLVAGEELRTAANALVTIHEDAEHRLRPAGPGQDEFDERIRDHTATLIAAARTDLKFEGGFFS